MQYYPTTYKSVNANLLDLLDYFMYSEDSNWLLHFIIIIAHRKAMYI